MDLADELMSAAVLHEEALGHSAVVSVLRSRPALLSVSDCEGSVDEA